MILFVLFGGSVGAVVFLHTQYGWDAVQQVLLAPCPFSGPHLSVPIWVQFVRSLHVAVQVLEQEMTRSVAKYRPENKLTLQFWDSVQV